CTAPDTCGGGGTANVCGTASTPPPGGGVTAKSCASADVQAAIDSAASGSTVVIPNGTCTWSSGVTIHGKAITLLGQSTAGVVLTVNTTYGIDVTEDTALHSEIGHLTATGSGTLMRIGAHTSPVD